MAIATDRDQEGLLPLRRALQSGKRSKSSFLGENVDFLVPLTLGKGVQCIVANGDLPVEDMLGSCSVETVKLFAEHVASASDVHRLWESNRTSQALKNNHVHRLEI